jgi:TetR/AcrR family transcriptional regulator of autoinduction and epiphytic fitness
VYLLNSGRSGVRSRQKHADILRAAAEQFIAVGFEAATMDAIAAAADVSKRTVYLHFGSKEGLFEAVVADLARQAGQNAGHVWQADKSIEDQLVAIGLAKFDFFEEPSFAALVRMVLAVFVSQPELAQKAVAAVQDCDSGIAGWLSSAQAAGALAGVDVEAADSLFGTMFMSSMLWPKLIGDTASRPERREQAIALARMFAAHLLAANDRDN